MNSAEGRAPSWLRKRLVSDEGLQMTRGTIAAFSVGTVCESSLCPNLNECFSKKHATFMILGRSCTRSCGFCSVNKGAPEAVDHNEPGRIAGAVEALGIKHAVVTSVTRDDLKDGGAGQFVRVIEKIKSASGSLTVEVLVPDFGGDGILIYKVACANPEIFAHNIETVRRLYPIVRPEASYDRSLDVLRLAKKSNPGLTTKSGIMVGLGESFEEVRGTMADLRKAGCDMLTVGQYLRPGEGHIAVQRFVRPEEFRRYELVGAELGFRHVASAPFVRSSYLADESYNVIKEGVYA